MRRQPGRPYQPRGGAGGGDLVGTGFATVLTAVSFLTLNTIGGGGEGGGAPPVEGAEQLQLVLACAILAAGLLFIMYGMRRPPRRPPRRGRPVPPPRRGRGGGGPLERRRRRAAAADAGDGPAAVPSSCRMARFRLNSEAQRDTADQVQGKRSPFFLSSLLFSFSSEYAVEVLTIALFVLLF